MESERAHELPQFFLDLVTIISTFAHLHAMKVISCKEHSSAHVPVILEIKHLGRTLLLNVSNLLPIQDQASI